ncbi:MAG: hypothetical protein Q4G35_13720, partial [Propionibacteriaceae bacterium]|nr:hypothetical protein [Propionibacteriaceae bacterium]
MIPRRLLRALLVATMFAIGIITSPLPAAADGDPLDVTITSITPAALNLSDPEQIVELRGTLVNTSTEPIRYVNVHFWRLPEALASMEQVTKLTAGGADLPLGARLFDDALGNLHLIRQDEEFGPGERADFHVKATVAQLTSGQYALTSTDVAYLLGVQVRGYPGGEGNQVVGRAQVAVAATDHPVSSSALVLLTAPPSWLPNGTFTDDSLVADLGGRLDTLLTSAERPRVESAVDPALYAAVERLSNPHVVDGEQRPGSGVALRWLSRVDELAKAGRLWRLPYGDPNLGRAEATNVLPQVLKWADDATPGALKELPTLAVLEDSTGELAHKLTDINTVVVRNARGAEPGKPRLLGASPQTGFTALPEGVRLARRITEDLLSPRPPFYVIDTPEAARADDELGAYRRHVPVSAVPATRIQWAEAPTPEAWPDVAEALTAVDAANVFQRILTASDEPADDPTLGALAYSKGFADQAAAVEWVKAGTPA